MEFQSLGEIGFEMALAVSYLSIPVLLFHMRTIKSSDECFPLRRVFDLLKFFLVGIGLTHLLSPLSSTSCIVDHFAKALNLATLVLAAWTSVEIYHAIPILRSMPSPCELQRLNNELEGHKENLSKVVAQRTYELNQEKARWQLVIDQLPQILWLKSLEGKIEFYNKKWYEYTGLSVGESLGSSCTTAIHPGDLQVLRSRWLDGGCRWKDMTDYKLRIKSAEGVFRWHIVRSMPIRDIHTQEVTQWCGVATDIHDNETMRELSAADASRKTRFLAMMSHEMRTPLTGIIGMSTLLGDTSLHGPQTEMLDNIKLSADKLLGLVNNILDLFKLHNEKLFLELSTFSLRDLMQETLTRVREDAVASNITLHSEFSSQIPGIIQADNSKLKQVLGHLLSNAVKFTPNGGDVYVSAQLENTDNRNMIRFSVRDTGIGIEDIDKPKMFEIFSQLDSSSTRRFDGSGIGLALAKGLVELLNGRIWFDSTPGQGSTFYFTFEYSDMTKDGASKVLERSLAPLASKPLLYTSSCEDILSSNGAIISQNGSAEREVYSSADEYSESESESTFADEECAVGLKILVVDDTEMNQKVLKRLLGSIGYSDVDVVADGMQAVHAMSSHAYDVVFMDMMMPVMDGVTATKEIRLLPHTTLGRQPHIIAVTANAFQDDIDRCITAGMCSHMAKPLKRDMLKKRMDLARQVRGGTEKCGCHKYHHHHHHHHHRASHHHYHAASHVNLVQNTHQRGVEAV